MRDHGGNIDQAIAEYGGAAETWIDLSTGINRVPYPIPSLFREAWTNLPTRFASGALRAAAAMACSTQAAILPLAGARAAIQMIPRLKPPGLARILSPTYNEHAACLRSAGWTIEGVETIEKLPGADLAVIVNPNNPDGRETSPQELLGLTETVGQLVVDESFVDPRPELSIAPQAGEKPGLFVLR